MKHISITFTFIFFIASIICTVNIQSSNAAEYKGGWDYINFYSAVEKCRESIVYQQIKAYEKKGLEKNQDINTLKNEMISITPVMDLVATNACFCIMNEFAKNNPLSLYENGIDYDRYMKIPRCQKAIEESVKTMKETLKNIQLK